MVLELLDMHKQKKKESIHKIFIKIKMNHRFQLVHWDDPEGWYGEGGGRREEGSGWGTHGYLWQIHFDIWQNQYNIVKLKN